MEKPESSQLELFHQTGDEATSAQRLSGTFLSYIRAYERLVLMLIGIVITGAVCFCVGVEKGKHIALSRVNANLDMAYRRTGTTGTTDPAAPAAATPVPTAAAVQAAEKATRPAMPAPVKAVQPITVAQTAQPSGSGYTIQIATYTGTTSAQREMNTLKKQGLLPVIRPSGNYTILCVGNFPDKATAKSLLTQLKRKYRDCYIRRL
ncbi:MAG: SPOR domain-containing protein [Candidatus Omnitrophica bacterium]|nr:SPOR domain-containing protein [Candidatus Omnitrophota bacterium]